MECWVMEVFIGDLFKNIEIIEDIVELKYFIGIFLVMYVWR